MNEAFRANLAWFLSCVPEYAAFLAASLRRRGPASAAGPPVEYESLQGDIDGIRLTGRLPLTGEPVRRLVPTSGTAAAPKLIPYTESLLAEMRRAFDAWVASLYLACPALLFGRHYWSLSPNTEPPDAGGSAVPVGFDDDIEYLRPCQRRCLRRLLVAPPEVARVHDAEAFTYATLLFMTREPNLRLISVWHPSFLTLLLDGFAQHRDEIAESIHAGRIARRDGIPHNLVPVLEKTLVPDPARAAAVAAVAPADPAFAMRLWPNLRVVSCWMDGHAARWRDDLHRRFPGAAIQGKGLLATEGVVSFPMGLRGAPVCAVRSHRIEFLDPRDGRVLGPQDVEIGAVYSVLLTTGGGLTRYRLHDVVRVAGLFHRIPRLRFVGRDNQTSDLVGEKLNAFQAQEAIAAVEQELGVRPRFAMLAPAAHGGAWRYRLYLEGDTDGQRAAAVVEKTLCGNFYYLHARRHGQLASADVRRVTDDAAGAYRAHLVRHGTKAGDVKFTPLSLRTDWDSVFDRRPQRTEASGSQELPIPDDSTA